MVKSFKIAGLAMFSGLLMTVGWVHAPHAATSATLDVLPNEVAGVPERVDVGPLKTAGEPEAAGG